MTEALMWQKMRPWLRGLDPVRVENSADLGVPDVNCTLGWIELKCLPKPPVREGTPMRVPHFRPQQRGWLVRRCSAGGKAWVLLLIASTDEWILLDGIVAAQRLGKVPLATLRALGHSWTSSHSTQLRLAGALRGSTP